MAQKLRFINKYLELETVDSGDWAESCGETSEKASGAGG